jgi:hypothetical protein
MVKRILIALAVLLSVYLVFIVGKFMLSPLLMYCGVNSLLNPSGPTITYHEFPFKLEYEQNDTRKVISDTFICQYDGVASNEGVGKYRKWKGKYASGGDGVTWKVDDDTEYSFGYDEEYLMDQDQFTKHGYSISDPVVELQHRVRGQEYTTWISYKEFEARLATAKIRILHWDYPKPITNSFH